MTNRIAWLAAVLIPARLCALGAEDTTRPTPPPEGPPREKAISAEKKKEQGIVEDENQILLERLSGLVVAPDAKRALALQQTTRHGVAVDGFPESQTLRIEKIAHEFVGKPVTLSSLNRLLEQLGEVSQNAGFLLQRISFPAQEITSGVIAVRMGPATVGAVRVSGRPAFGMDHLRKSFRTRSGEPLDEGRILDDIEWLNRNPLRRATIIHSQAEDDDVLDLTLRVRAAKAWRAYGGIDNQLSETLGDERLYLGFQHGDVWGKDHRITGQLTSALDTNALFGGSLIYQIPLPSRNLLEVSGGYTTSETDVPGPLDQSGEFTRAAVDHRLQLPRWHGIAHEWRNGLEFRNNDYLFPSNRSETVRFFQIKTGWEGRREDGSGTTRLGVLALYNPGQGVLGSEDRDYIALGADGAESLIARITAERVQRMDKLGSLVLRGRGQWADSKLLASDEFSAGGMAGVRGFDEIVGYASNGLLGTLEWQSPLGKHDTLGEWMGLIFADGAVLDRDRPTDEGEMLSAGLGCRFRWKERVSGRMDIGFPIERPSGVDSDPVLHFALGLSW